MPARNYPRAPITEALIDLRVTFEVGVSLDMLKKFGNEVQEDYPTEAPRELVQGQISVVDSIPQTQASRTTIGYIFHSPDRLQAVQARLDGFTFSRLAPYKDWEHLTAEARRLWAVFTKVLQPSTVTRVAVRYINQINLPLHEGTLQFEKYLRTFPQIMGIEEDIDLEQFFVRLVMPQKDLSAQLILTEALLPAQGDSLGVILDIDLFKENMFFDAGSNEIWSTLDSFRARKNKYFEASITDAARELFA